ncbi:MAG: alpha-glucan family phosphorylase [Bacteroidales bacterium]|nr:alpha-glucan family phosphorylase [Bacteroidales bacterium]
MKTTHSSNQPQWSSVTVQSTMPAGLEKMQELAHNLWWSWNVDVIRLFKEIDKALWAQVSGNPAAFLESLSYTQLEQIAKDEVLMQRLDDIYAKFRSYMDVPVSKEAPTVAYFSMEYGLSDVLKIYSGGLGVLAGDYLKEASDCNIPMTAVGFLYRNGYFTQGLSMEGQQIAIYEPQNFNTLPIEQVKDEQDNPLVLKVEFPGYLVHCNIWKVAVGRVNLYLIDTDHPGNGEYERQITAQLYGGDWENRLKQEYLLGVGGIQLLNTLGIKKQVYHCNEGHAALINAQRMVDLIAKDGLNFGEALEVVRASSLYTVHTPVPAGHDKFDEGLMFKYMSSFPQKLGISWAEFMDMGRENRGDNNEKFSMSVFACNCCQEVNGVSMLHGRVSQKMFSNIWKGYFPNELHVGYVTNGVHMPSWTASEWRSLYEKTFGPEWMGDQSNAELWKKIYQVSDEEIWKTRQQLKLKLIAYIRDKYKNSWFKNQGDPSRIMAILEKINPNALMIGFGRRFATYKRAHLLFTDLERLSRIVNNPLYPVQFVFTGKAHPADGGGQGLIKRIVEISRMPEFQGKIIFLENYDMALARRMISGVDIWLNTPTRPLEASGTSGQKAEMNGVLNFSVLDGWWLEGYVEKAGWALSDKRTYENQEYQDQLDAATIYSMLENDIIPLFFAKNSKGYSPEWVQYIKNSIAQIAPHFTTKRMLDDYIERFYSKLVKRSALLISNDYAKTREISLWKQEVAAKWEEIRVLQVDIPEGVLHQPKVGSEYTIGVSIDPAGLKDSLGVELVILHTDIDGSSQNYSAELELKSTDDKGQLRFETNYRFKKTGTFSYSFRMFPKHPEMPHRMDFCYTRWF